MEKPNTPEEMVARFNEIDGIEANEASPSTGRSLVKVMESKAIGAFFKECRENGYKRSSTSRNHIEYTVLDSWVTFE